MTSRYFGVQSEAYRRPSQGGLPQSSDVVGMRCLFLALLRPRAMSGFLPLLGEKQTSGG